MTARLDSARMAELERVMGDEFAAILTALQTSVDSALRDVADALAAGDLQRGAFAAHHCRNDALTVGAQPLLEALAGLEQAARDGHLPDAAAAFETVTAVWPPTRDELDRAKHRATHRAQETGPWTSS